MAAQHTEPHRSASEGHEHSPVYRMDVSLWAVWHAGLLLTLHAKCSPARLSYWGARHYQDTLPVDHG